MKAAVYRRYGAPDVVRIETVVDPKPRADELLIKVRAATVSTGDARVRSLRMPPGFGLLARPVFGLFGPRKKILGTELAGEVVARGRSVTRFREGDHVFAFPDLAMGAHAELVAIAADGLVGRKPSTLNLEEASALCFGGATALYYLREAARLAPGDRALVIGASGAVGGAAVQIAKSLGAEVTGVSSAANLDLVRRLGADFVIDYRSDDSLDGGRTYDVIMDTVGEATFETCARALAPGGRLILVAAALRDVIGSGKRSEGSRVIAGPAKTTPVMIEDLRRLAEDGQFRPAIDCVLPFAEIVAAHARVDSGRKRGSVVVTIPH